MAAAQVILRAWWIGGLTITAGGQHRHFMSFINAASSQQLYTTCISNKSFSTCYHSALLPERICRVFQAADLSFGRSYGTSSFQLGRKSPQSGNKPVVRGRPQRTSSSATAKIAAYGRGKVQQEQRTPNRSSVGAAEMQQKVARSATKLTSAAAASDKARTHKRTASKVRVKEKAGLEGNANAKALKKHKKKKITMRIHPSDMTAKRLVDGYPLPGEEVTENDCLEKSNLSRNAQFRAIVPAPKLLQHIERHLLGRRRLSEWQKAGYNLKIMPAPLDNAPFSKKPERQPTQEEIFRHKLRFTAAAKVSTSLPAPDIPEVAFAGRSNVGKSSLINALTRQWGVARTSDKPGLTQITISGTATNKANHLTCGILSNWLEDSMRILLELIKCMLVLILLVFLMSINFFRLGGRLCLVDLPGHGFAYAKESTKGAWEELVKEFVTTRVGLKRVCVLVDSKWGLKLGDEQLVQLMERAGMKYQIVLTKTDTVSPIDLARRVTQIQEVFKENKNMVLPMMMVSSKTGEGLELLRGNLAKLASPSLI